MRNFKATRYASGVARKLFERCKSWEMHWFMKRIERTFIQGIQVFDIKQCVYELENMGYISSILKQIFKL